MHKFLNPLLKQQVFFEGAESGPPMTEIQNSTKDEKQDDDTGSFIAEKLAQMEQTHKELGEDKKTGSFIDLIPEKFGAGTDIKRVTDASLASLEKGAEDWDFVMKVVGPTVQHMERAGTLINSLPIDEDTAVELKAEMQQAVDHMYEVASYDGTPLDRDDLIEGANVTKKYREAQNSNASFAEYSQDLAPLNALAEGASNVSKILEKAVLVADDKTENTFSRAIANPDWDPKKHARKDLMDGLGDIPEATILASRLRAEATAMEQVANKMIEAYQKEGLQTSISKKVARKRTEDMQRAEESMHDTAEFDLDMREFRANEFVELVTSNSDKLRNVVQKEAAVMITDPEKYTLDPQLVSGARTQVMQVIQSEVIASLDNNFGGVAVDNAVAVRIDQMLKKFEGENGDSLEEDTENPSHYVDPALIPQRLDRVIAGLKIAPTYEVVNRSLLSILETEQKKFDSQNGVSPDTIKGALVGALTVEVLKSDDELAREIARGEFDDKKLNDGVTKLASFMPSKAYVDLGDSELAEFQANTLSYLGRKVLPAIHQEIKNANTISEVNPSAYTSVYVLEKGSLGKTANDEKLSIQGENKLLEYKVVGGDTPEGERELRRQLIKQNLFDAPVANE